MRVKYNLRSILSDVLARSPITGPKERIKNNGLIKNVLTGDGLASLGGQPIGCHLRILAKDEQNADAILKTVASHKDDLNIKQIHKLDKAVEYSRYEQLASPYSHSIVVERDLGEFLKSTIEDSRENEAPSYLRKAIIEDDIITRVAIEYSSPNIAKPFHYGHLRSTLQGNLLSNLHSYLGIQVSRINYLGDWGTQYGLLTLGLDESGVEIDKLESPLKQLVDIYVEANAKAAADEQYFERAKCEFARMESKLEPRQIERWRKIRSISMEELKKSYSLLGVRFDNYEFESEYADACGELVRELVAKNVAYRSEDGAAIARIEKNYRPVEVAVQKSDGSFLYLTRDVAAAVSRKRRLKFERMLYVVGAEQERHFHALKQLIRALGLGWSDELVHVKVGKVANMSTRSGSFVLLAELVDEATRLYAATTRNTPTSRVSAAEVPEVARQLALSALFVYDLRCHRYHSYELSWPSVMSRGESSGINLQTAHARLCGLIDRAGSLGLEPFERLGELAPDAVRCLEATSLLSRLNELDTSLHQSYWSLDSRPLVSYALALCTAINRARQSDRLRVVGEPDGRLARTRLTLFEAARNRLRLAMTLIGLRPLDKV